MVSTRSKRKRPALETIPEQSLKKSAQKPPPPLNQHEAQWIGPCVVQDHKKFFRQVQITHIVNSDNHSNNVETELFNIQDHVFIQMDMKSNVVCTGQICAFFEDLKTHEKLMELLWFYDQDDLRTRLKDQKSFTGYQSKANRYKLPNHIVNGFKHENELLATDHVEILDVDCLEEKIHFLTSFEELLLYAQDSAENDVEICFFAESVFSSKTGAVFPFPKEKPEQLLLQNSQYFSVYYKDKQDDTFDPYHLAVRRLHLDIHPENLPARKAEATQVMNFLRDGIKGQGTGQVLYVSGMPGTGKTATVLNVLRKLQKSEEKKVVSPFKVIYLNGMRLTHPNAVFRVIWQELFRGKPPSSDVCYKSIEKYFLTEEPNRQVSILVVDEVDYLVTIGQKIIFSLLDWPTKKNSKLIVIAISNTMDLPDRLMSRCSSRLGFGRMTFLPYSASQIKEIIEERLQDLEYLFDQTAIKLCSRRVANTCGDIRRAFQICRAAIESRKGSIVGINDVTKVMSDKMAPPLQRAIQELPVGVKNFLMSLCYESRKLNQCTVPLLSVLRRYNTQFLHRPGLSCSPLSYWDAKSIIYKLVRMNFIATVLYEPPATNDNLCVESECNQNTSSPKKVYQATNETKITHTPRSKKVTKNEKPSQIDSSIDEPGGNISLEIVVSNYDLALVLSGDPYFAKLLDDLSINSQTAIS